MGCSCNKKAMRTSSSNRPIIGPKSVRSPSRVLPTQARIQAQNPPTPKSTSPSGLSDDRRNIERIRREAIRKALGK
jgi:hypothetical protein